MTDAEPDERPGVAGEPAEKDKNKYWIRLGGGYKGPLDAWEIALLPGVGNYTLLCPGRLDPAERRNWKFAGDFPAVREALSQPADGLLTRLQKHAEEHPRAFRPRLPALIKDASASILRIDLAALRRVLLRCAVILAAGAAWIAPQAFRRAPAPRAAAGPPAQPWAPALDLRLPGCGVSLGQKAGSIPLVKRLGGDQYVLELANPGGREPILFRYDEREKILRPLNNTTRDLTDYRKPCP